MGNIGLLTTLLLSQLVVANFAMAEDYRASVVTPLDGGSISREKELAHKIYRRITGTRVPIDHPLISQMETKIKSGDLIAAAALATNEANFINVTVRSMAARWSNLGQELNVPFNDLTATVMGVVRDNLDARLLLTGDFTYQGNADVISGLPMSPRAIHYNNQSIGISSPHYLFFDNGIIDTQNVLRRVSPQTLMSRSFGEGPTAIIESVVNPEPAGVITTRAFMASHVSNGTNRRPVEYTFRVFTCATPEMWADTGAPDSRVGRDIDRFPGGDPTKFKSSCIGCHSVMDGFRGAFAHVTMEFPGMVSSNSLVHPKPGEQLPGGVTVVQDINKVTLRMNQNRSVFPEGYVTKDASFVNHATGSSNLALFGWRGPASGGKGILEFTKMVADSRRFSECMVKRAYEAVCKQNVEESEMRTWVRDYATQFETDGYNFRRLFQRLVVKSSCIGGLL